MPYLPIKNTEFISRKGNICDVLGCTWLSKRNSKDVSSYTADEKKFLDSLMSCSEAKLFFSVLPTY